MYILSVIPIKRRIPSGELTYISKEKVSVGSILSVPLKKSKELVVVIKQNEVSKEKEFIKSINFKLVTLSDLQIIACVPKKVMDAINDFAKYSICEIDSIIRVLFSKIQIETYNKKINNKQIIITTKENKNLPESISFHKSLGLFLNNKYDFDQIIIDNPKSLTLYGQNYLGFDPVVFFLILSKKIDKKITFNSNISVLAYEEWNLNKKNKNLSHLGDLHINIRDSENKKDKVYPLSAQMFDLFKESLIKNKKILIIINTKNYAPRTVCHDCAQLHECINCNKALALVSNNRNYAKKYGVSGNYIYICTNCSLAESSIVKCRNCDSWNLIPLGYGREKLIEQLKSNLDKKNLDKVYDMTDRINANNLKSWENNGGVLIIRPSNIYEIDSADVCFIPSVSPMLYGKDFSSLEFTRNLIEDTRMISQEVYLSVMSENEQSILNEDNKTWLKNEILDRKSFFYPPYGRLLKIEFDSYASKSSVIIGAVLFELDKIAISNTVNKDKNENSNVIITASFDASLWSVSHDNYETAQKVKNILYPFLKHLKIEVY